MRADKDTETQREEEKAWMKSWPADGWERHGRSGGATGGLHSAFQAFSKRESVVHLQFSTFMGSSARTLTNTLAGDQRSGLLFTTGSHVYGDGYGMLTEKKAKKKIPGAGTLAMSSSGLCQARCRVEMLASSLTRSHQRGVELIQG